MNQNPSIAQLLNNSNVARRLAAADVSQKTAAAKAKALAVINQMPFGKMPKLQRAISPTKDQSPKKQGQQPKAPAQKMPQISKAPFAQLKQKASPSSKSSAPKFGDKGILEMIAEQEKASGHPPKLSPSMPPQFYPSKANGRTKNDSPPILPPNNTGQNRGIAFTQSIQPTYNIFQNFGPASMQGTYGAQQEGKQAQPPSMPAGVPPSLPAGVPPSLPAGVPPSLSSGVPPSLPAGVPPSMPTAPPPGSPQQVQNYYNQQYQQYAYWYMHQQYLQQQMNQMMEKQKQQFNHDSPANQSPAKTVAKPPLKKRQEVPPSPSRKGKAQATSPKKSKEAKRLGKFQQPEGPKEGDAPVISERLSLLRIEVGTFLGSVEPVPVNQLPKNLSLKLLTTQMSSDFAFLKTISDKTRVRMIHALYIGSFDRLRALQEESPGPQAEENLQEIEDIEIKYYEGLMAITSDLKFSDEGSDEEAEEQAKQAELVKKAAKVVKSAPVAPVPVTPAKGTSVQTRSKALLKGRIAAISEKLRKASGSPSKPQPETHPKVTPPIQPAPLSPPAEGSLSPDLVINNCLSDKATIENPEEPNYPSVERGVATFVTKSLNLNLDCLNYSLGKHTLAQQTDGRFYMVLFDKELITSKSMRLEDFKELPKKFFCLLCAACQKKALRPDPKMIPTFDCLEDTHDHLQSQHRIDLTSYMAAVKNDFRANYDKLSHLRMILHLNYNNDFYPICQVCGYTAPLIDWKKEEGNFDPLYQFADVAKHLEDAHGVTRGSFVEPDTSVIIRDKFSMLTKQKSNDRKLVVKRALVKSCPEICSKMILGCNWSQIYMPTIFRTGQINQRRTKSTEGPVRIVMYCPSCEAKTFIPEQMVEHLAVIHDTSFSQKLVENFFFKYKQLTNYQDYSRKAKDVEASKHSSSASGLVNQDEINQEVIKHINMMAKKAAENPRSVQEKPKTKVIVLQREVSGKVAQEAKRDAVEEKAQQRKSSEQRKLRSAKDLKSQKDRPIAQVTKKEVKPKNSEFFPHFAYTLPPMPKPIQELIQEQTPVATPKATTEPTSDTTTEREAKRQDTGPQGQAPETEPAEEKKGAEVDQEMTNEADDKSPSPDKAKEASPEGVPAEATEDRTDNDAKGTSSEEVAERRRKPSLNESSDDESDLAGPKIVIPNKQPQQDQSGEGQSPRAHLVRSNLPLKQRIYIPTVSKDLELFETQIESRMCQYDKLLPTMQWPLLLNSLSNSLHQEFDKFKIKSVPLNLRYGQEMFRCYLAKEQSKSTDDETDAFVYRMWTKSYAKEIALSNFKSPTLAIHWAPEFVREPVLPPRDSVPFQFDEIEVEEQTFKRAGFDPRKTEMVSERRSLAPGIKARGTLSKIAGKSRGRPRMSPFTLNRPATPKAAYERLDSAEITETAMTRSIKAMNRSSPFIRKPMTITLEPKYERDGDYLSNLQKQILIELTHIKSKVRQPKPETWLDHGFPKFCQRLFLNRFTAYEVPTEDFCLGNSKYHIRGQFSFDEDLNLQTQGYTFYDPRDDSEATNPSIVSIHGYFRIDESTMKSTEIVTTVNELFTAFPNLRFERNSQHAYSEAEALKILIAMRKAVILIATSRIREQQPPIEITFFNESDSFTDIIASMDDPRCSVNINEISVQSPDDQKVLHLIPNFFGLFDFKGTDDLLVLEQRTLAASLQVGFVLELGQIQQTENETICNFHCAYKKGRKCQFHLQYSLMFQEEKPPTTKYDCLPFKFKSIHVENNNSNKLRAKKSICFKLNKYYNIHSHSLDLRLFEHEVQHLVRQFVLPVQGLQMI